MNYNMWVHIYLIGYYATFIQGFNKYTCFEMTVIKMIENYLYCILSFNSALKGDDIKLWF